MTLGTFLLIALAVALGNILYYMAQIGFTLSLQLYQIRQLKKLQEAQADAARSHKLGVVKNDGLPN